MIQIYHNPRCSKSREGRQILEDSKKEFEVIEYMKSPLPKKDLELIVKKLKIKPIELVRKNEPLWKENFRDKNLNDDELIEIMIKNPQLIERPIVINGNKAVIGRPPILIKDIL